MLANGIRNLNQPGTVFCHFENVHRGEIFRRILGGIAKWLEKPGIDERRDVMRLAVQHPARLFRRQAGGQLPQQRQEVKLIVFHTRPVAGKA